MTILIIRRCVDWSFLFISSVIVHVPEVYKRDGVTVASKSLSLSRSMYARRRQFLSAAPDSDPVVELDFDYVLEGDELAEVFDFSSSGGRITMFIP